jgi:hypothetical protein
MSVRLDIKEWIERLSVPQTAFNNQPTCPFAMRADLDIIVTESYAEFITRTLRAINNFRFGRNHVDIIVPMFPSAFDGNNIWTLSEELNKILVKKDLIVYVSDPLKPFIVDGVRTTNEYYLFIILQQMSELSRASAQLWRKGYYDKWPVEMYDKIVAPRSIK